MTAPPSRRPAGLALADVAQGRILGERACAGYEAAHGLFGSFLELIGQGYDGSWLAGREAMVRGAASRLGPAVPGSSNRSNRQVNAPTDRPSDPGRLRRFPLLCAESKRLAIK